MDIDADTLESQAQQVNRLTVIASDGYKDFVVNLQKLLREIASEIAYILEIWRYLL